MSAQEEANQPDVTVLGVRQFRGGYWYALLQVEGSSHLKEYNLLQHSDALSAAAAAMKLDTRRYRFSREFQTLDEWLGDFDGGY